MTKDRRRSSSAARQRPRARFAAENAVVHNLFPYLYDAGIQYNWCVIFAVTIFSVVLFAQSPQRSPDQGITESKNAQGVSNSERGDKTKDTHQSLAGNRLATSQPSVDAAPTNADSNAENLNVQQRVEIFTGVLAGVGILQLGVMFFTWMVYRRQAGIMTTQIETTQDTERAWIIANPVENAPCIGFALSTDAGNLERHLVGVNQQNIVSFSFKSTGRTPARLVETAILYRKVNRLEEIPKEPNYGERTPLHDLPLVTEDSIGFEQFLEPNPILSKPEADAIWRREAFLYTFGIIVYRDVYDRLHETRFGFLYHHPLGGDPRQRGLRRELMPATYNCTT